MLISKRNANEPVKARLLVEMVVDGEDRAKGEIVDLPARDFRYLEQHGRVELAPAKVK